MSKWENHCKDCRNWSGKDQDIKDYGWNKGFYYCNKKRSWEDPEDAYKCDDYEYERSWW